MLKKKKNPIKMVAKCKIVIVEKRILHGTTV